MSMRDYEDEDEDDGSLNRDGTLSHSGIDTITIRSTILCMGVPGIELPPIANREHPRPYEQSDR